MLHRIIKHKAYIFYTFFKYVEYGILAFIFMSFANLVSPEDYGNASLGFQVITYSAFLVLGVNQVLLKRYSLENNNQIKTFFLQYNVIYNIIACIVGVVLVWLVFGFKTYALSLGIICGFKLIVESSVAVNRVKGNIGKINLIYLSYSGLFLILYLFYVSNVKDFFKFWSYAILFGALVGTSSSLIKVFKGFSIENFKSFYNIKSKLLFNDGLKLASMALLAPLFSTLNIIFLNFFDIDKTVIGNFQLADNIANVVSLGGASILFIIFPDVIKQISKDKSKIRSFYNRGLKIIVLCVLVLLALYYPLKMGSTFFFADYVELPYLIFFTLISRLLILLLFIPSAVFITFSKEPFYIRTAAICLLIMAVIFTVFLSVASIIQIYDYFLIFQIIILLVIHVYFHRKISKIS